MNGPITWRNETRKLRDLIPWERNPRQIREEQAARLEESREEFNQAHVFLIGPDDDLYDGHQRLETWMRKYGPDLEVAVRVSSRPLTEQEKQKLSVFLHTGAHGDWNWDALSGWDFDDLNDWGFDADTLAQWNDDAANLALMLEAEEEEPPEDPGAQVDKAEELREKWGVRSGQLWQLGEHRLICGDCTDAAVVERVMGVERAVLGIHDPPYNLGDVCNDTVIELEVGGTERAVQGDWDEGYDITPLVMHCMELLDGRGSFYVFCAPEQLASLLAFRSKQKGVCYGGQIVFEKTNAVWSIRKATWRWVHENVAWGRHKDAPWNFLGQDEMRTVHSVGNVTTTGHPTAKNPDLVGLFVRASSNEGDVIVDYFSGSGTTLIACERLSRRCRAVEIEPKYVAVTLDRWAEMTGMEPVLVE